MTNSEVLRATITVAELSSKLTKTNKPQQIIKTTNKKTFHFVNGNLKLGKTYDVEYSELPSTDPKYAPSKWISKVLTPQVTPQDPIVEKAKEMFNAKPITTTNSVNNTAVTNMPSEPREILEIKEKLESMPIKYEAQGIKCSQSEAKYKLKEANYEIKLARTMLELRELHKDQKEGFIKEKAADKMAEDRVDLIGYESDYEYQKTILESMDKAIQLLRNRCDLIICENYSTHSLDKIGNLRERK